MSGELTIHLDFAGEDVSTGERRWTDRYCSHGTNFTDSRTERKPDLKYNSAHSRLLIQTSFIQALDGAETGKVFRSPHTKYYKCEVYRLTPLSTKGYISVDGESVPLEPIQVECHRGLARVLSITGQWYSEVVDI